MTPHKHARQKRDLKAQIVMGLGLLLLGVALIFILRPQGEAASSPPSDEASVVPVAVSFRAPELSLHNLSGEAESLADYGENVVLVNNWATWCPPCKAEMPTLEAYYEAHASDGLMIIAIEAGETRADVLPFVQTFGLKFPIWLDPQNASLAAFRNQNLPNSYVIDRSGTVRYAWTGPVSRTMLEQYVTPLLAPIN